MPIPLPLTACRRSKGVRQKHRIKNDGCSYWRRGRNNSGTAAHSTSNQGKENCAAGDRRTARENSLCLRLAKLWEDSWVDCRFSRMSEALEQSPDSLVLWPRYTPLERGASSSDSSSLGWRQVQDSSQCNGGCSKTGTASLPHVKFAIMSAAGPFGERHEHLMPSFLLALDRSDGCFGCSISSQSSGPQGASLKNVVSYTIRSSCFCRAKDFTTETFDDDEWFRSLTEAQEIAADIPDERITYDQDGVDTQKVRPVQMGACLRNMSPIG